MKVIHRSKLLRLACRDPIVLLLAMKVSLKLEVVTGLLDVGSEFLKGVACIVGILDVVPIAFCLVERALSDDVTASHNAASNHFCPRAGELLLLLTACFEGLRGLVAVGVVLGESVLSHQGATSSIGQV